jgi:sensor histidine kinase YesM
MMNTLRTFALTRWKAFLFQIMLWSGFAALVVAAHSTLASNRSLTLNILVRILELAFLYNAHQFLYERLFVARRYRLYAALFGLALLACGIALQTFRVWNSAENLVFWNGAEIMREILAAGLFFMMVMGVVVFIRHIKNQFALQEAQHEARALKAASELKMLQAQINPHFLFNTLHSLYSLVSVRSDASQDKAQEVILMLSGIMRYTYETANVDTVLLSEEVGTIERFLALHRIRFGKRAELRFESHGNVDLWRIPPFLLLTFIENAIKHGIETTPREARLDAHLEVHQELLFTVTNTKTAPNTSNHAMFGESSQPSAVEHISQTGLQNVRRRLELLYPECSELRLTETETSFTAEIRLWKKVSATA